jgi:hypothetical protein
MKLTDEQRWSEINPPLYAKPRKVHSTYTLEFSQDLSAMKRY